MYEPVQSSSAHAAVPAVARFQLRPLSTGEVLDRSLSLFRSMFWFCAGLTLIPAVIQLLSGIVRVVYYRVAHLSPLTSAYSNPFLLVTMAVGSLLAFAAFGFASAGLQWGVGSVYLGRPASFQGALRIVQQHWLRYAGLALVQILSASWVTLLAYAALAASFLAMRGNAGSTTGIVLIGLFGFLAFLSVPYSTYRYIRVSLAMPAAVLEGLGIRDALRRSRALLPDRKGRIFVLFLLLGAFYMVIGVVVGLLSLFSLRGAMQPVFLQLITLLTGFAATVLLQPFFNIALCLFYYDERVRREGFDIEYMMSEAAAASGLASGAGVRVRAPLQEL